MSRGQSAGASPPCRHMDTIDLKTSLAPGGSWTCPRKERYISVWVAGMRSRADLGQHQLHSGGQLPRSNISGRMEVSGEENASLC